MSDHDRQVGDPEVTDVRLPEKWLNDRRLVKLSDPAYRLFVASLLWSVTNRTDGMIETADLPTIPHVDTSHVSELVAGRLWRDISGGWVIADYSATQTARGELERLETIRRGDRERKARERATKASSQHVPPDVSAGSPPDASMRTVEARTGQDRDRLGQEGLPPDENENELIESPPVASRLKSPPRRHVPAPPVGVLACDLCSSIGPTRIDGCGRRVCVDGCGGPS